MLAPLIEEEDMADMKENYSPTEGERLHRLSMTTGSNALREAIKREHPQIFAVLTKGTKA
jgi:hypothetical protein